MISASLRYKVYPYAIKAHEVADLAGGSSRAEFYSKADNSTTIIGIPILIAGGCWAGCQLHAGIRYIPTPSKLRISLDTVEGIHRGAEAGLPGARGISKPVYK